MLLRALCGIAGIFAGSIAIWVILSSIQGPLPIGVPFLAFGIAFPVMMAYLALPDCRWWGKRPRKRNVRFFCPGGAHADSGGGDRRRAAKSLSGAIVSR